MATPFNASVLSLENVVMHIKVQMKTSVEISPQTTRLSEASMPGNPRKYSQENRSDRGILYWSQRAFLSVEGASHDGVGGLFSYSTPPLG